MTVAPRFGVNYVPSHGWWYSWVDWDERAIAADLAAGRPAYVGGFAGPDPPQAVRDGFTLDKVGLVYRVVGAK